MSGHDKDAPVYLPRGMLSLPFEVDDDVVTCFFPNYPKYCMEQRSIDGCKEHCTGGFLNEVLPYCCKVLLRDGYYWIKQYPEHHIARVIVAAINRSKGDHFTMYMDWVETAFVEVNEIEKRYEDQVVNSMDNSIKKSHIITTNRIESLCQKVEKGFKESLKSLDNVLESVDVLRAEIIKNNGSKNDISSAHVLTSVVKAKVEEVEDRRISYLETLKDVLSAPKRRNIVEHDRYQVIPELSRVIKPPQAMMAQYFDNTLWKYDSPNCKEGWSASLRVFYCRMMRYKDIIEDRLLQRVVISCNDPNNVKYRDEMRQQAFIMDKERISADVVLGPNKYFKKLNEDWQKMDSLGQQLKITSMFKTSSALSVDSIQGRSKGSCESMSTTTEVVCDKSGENSCNIVINNVIGKNETERNEAGINKKVAVKLI